MPVSTKKLQLRRDTTANWTLIDPVLAQGEPAVDLTDYSLKIGDGVKKWSELANIGEDEGVTVTAGTYTKVVVNASGYVTSGSNPATLNGYGITDAIASNTKGVANGVATLDESGLVPASQLPSYVDDVVEFNNFDAFPASGVSNKIYVALDTNRVYRWSGSQYVDITQSLLSQVNNWSAAQRGAFVTLTSASASIGINLALSNNYVHALTENTTLAAPTNAVAGQSGLIEFNQHASTPMTLSFNSFWKFAGGTVPTLTATNSAKDILSYTVNADGLSATCVMLKDVK